MSKREPSKYQTAILEEVESGTGDIIVNAVAGSGKTTTLVMAAGKLKTSNALFCAFSKEVQLEIDKRLVAQGSRMVCKTMHAIGMNAVSRYLKHAFGRRVDVQGEKYDPIIKQEAARIHDRIMADYRAELRRGNDDIEEPVDFGTVAGWIRSLVNLIRCTLADYSSKKEIQALADHYGVDVEDEHFNLIFKSVSFIIDEGAKLAGERGIIDFTDMIYLPARWDLPVDRFDFVFVDECQDLSRAQLSIALKSRAEGGRMLFVGDRNQSIYGFTGADPESFDRIIETTGAKLLPLSICYRCPASAIRMAQEIVPAIEAAPDAIEGLTAWISEKQIAGLVREGDMILCRKVAPLVATCISLISQRIPARVKGRDIAKNLTVIVKEIAGKKGLDMQDFAEKLDAWKGRKVSKIKAIGKEVENKIEKVEDEALGVLAVYESGEYMSPEALIADIEGLFSDGRAAVTLSSIHRAKGLEADRVIILEADAVEMQFKGMRKWQIFQEECAHYVALTRVKKEMYLCPATKKEGAEKEEG